ncbi:MAG: aspartate-semialdehyde dehydrogenase [Neisseriales bacterium]|nr:MAG: aspartate-semialdehyde dehydrogenase [Neisseriales bacterium]
MHTQAHRLPVGFIGWRGMVGSILMTRMKEEADFISLPIQPIFFSTSQTVDRGPDIGDGQLYPVKQAYDIDALCALPVIVTCQGGDYTNAVYPTLKQRGWRGYWIDAASTLRMDEEAVIILDPVNRPLIDKALRSGIRTYVGANCTVSLMLIALAGLFQEEAIEWVTTMTYQAASGAGAQHMRELILGMGAIYHSAQSDLINSHTPIIDIDRKITKCLTSDGFPKMHFDVPLAGNLIPWIDKDLSNGQSREEWKGSAETNKILGRKQHQIPIDGLCVRIGAMRCHSQALTIKLRKKMSMHAIEACIAQANDWVKVIPNKKEDSIEQLTPAAVSGSLVVPIGRLRKLTVGDDYLSAFTVGDQLLWGAAEPIRRMIKIVLTHQFECYQQQT